MIADPDLVRPITGLRRMTEDDLPALHALSVDVGWPHRQEDWAFALECGHGTVATDDAGRVMGSAMWWPFGPRYATVGMIIVSTRLQAQGTGGRLMRVLFDEAGDRALQLTGTPQGIRLYEREGFVHVGRIHQRQGIAKALPEIPGIAPRRATPSDLPALCALDAASNGADRSLMIGALFERSEVVVTETAGTITGASFCRPFGRGHTVGPVLAPDDATAVALLRPHTLAHAGTFLRADTPRGSGAFVDALAAANMAQVDTGALMRRGPDLAPQAPQTLFAIVNQAMG